MIACFSPLCKTNFIYFVIVLLLSLEFCASLVIPTTIKLQKTRIAAERKRKSTFPEN